MKRKPVKPVPKPAARAKEPETKALRISMQAAADMKEATRRTGIRASFAAARPMKGVLPKGVKYAMDDACEAAIGWATQNVYNVAFAEGYSFLGYPYLSQLAQIAEYRNISEVISDEATRKWVEIKSTSNDKKKLDVIKAITEKWEELKVREAFELASYQDSTFGRSHIYLDTGDTDNPDELMKPLTAVSAKIKKNGLRAIQNVEPIWCYPQAYNATNPLKRDWYNPEIWYSMGIGLHRSRLLTFVGRPVPDLLKPAFSFGGLSLIQMAKPYVDNWLQTRQSVNDLIQAFSQMVLSTDMSTILQGGAAESLLTRLDIFNNTRNNRGVMALNKDTETFQNVSAPLGSLDALQAQAQEHMAAVSRIPLVKLLGITPSGLNASSEGEIRVFYDTIHAYQEKFFKEHLTTVFRVTQLSLFGKIDPDLTYEFLPMMELDEKGQAEVNKTNAETRKTYIDAGILSQEEVRTDVVNDVNLNFQDIDPDEVPEPILESEHVRETEKVEGDPIDESA